MRTRFILAGIAAALLSACGHGETATADTSIAQTTAATPAAGPVAHVTSTDGKSVSLATQFELTDSTFRKFMNASDSLAVLAARDTSVKRIADNPFLSGAGSTDDNAGVKLLQSNTAISNSIAAAGLSVPEYFVMSIAIASGERFMKNPKAAPPTPALTKNADFLRQHPGELARLDAMSAGTPVTVSH